MLFFGSLWRCPVRIDGGIPADWANQGCVLVGDNNSERPMAADREETFYVPDVGQPGGTGGTAPLQYTTR